MKLNVCLSGEIHTDWREKIKAGCKALGLAVTLTSAITNHEASDAAVIRLGDKYKQWNAAFDAGYCAAKSIPYITLHGDVIVHPLKEVDA